MEATVGQEAEGQNDCLILPFVAFFRRLIVGLVTDLLLGNFLLKIGRGELRWCGGKGGYLF